MPELIVPTDRPPIGVAAGVIKTEEQINLYSTIPEIAALVIGSYSMNENIPDRPEGSRIFYYDESQRAAYNAFRLRNPGLEKASKYLPDCIKAVRAAGQLAIVSVTALEGEDPLEVIPELAEWVLTLDPGISGPLVDGIEINGSCPNQGSSDLLCDDVEATVQVFDAVRKRVGNEPYLIFKPSALEEAKIRRYKQLGLPADAVAAINGRRTRSPIDPQTGKHVIGVSDGYAGQSGPIIAPVAQENLVAWQQPVENAPRYDMLSVGGVDNGFEMHERERLGALMVFGAQDFYRAPHPAPVAQRWAGERRQAIELAAAA